MVIRLQEFQQTVVENERHTRMHAIRFQFLSSSEQKMNDEELYWNRMPFSLSFVTLRTSDRFLDRNETLCMVETRCYHGLSLHPHDHHLQIDRSIVSVSTLQELGFLFIANM